MSKEIANEFVEALRKLEEDRDVEALVVIRTEDCAIGNVAVSKTFSGHDGHTSSGRAIARPSRR